MITSTFLNDTAGNILYGEATLSKAITCVYLCNMSDSTITANVYLVPLGAIQSECKIYDSLDVAARDTAILDSEKIILENGESIWADCSVAGAIRMTISSVGI